MSGFPEPALIEIVEKGVREDGLIVPNEVRLNGVPLLVSADEPLVVHEIRLPGNDVVRVTLTLFARRVVIGDDAHALDVSA